MPRYANKRCPTGCGHGLLIGQGLLYGCAICEFCGYKEVLDIEDSQPKSILTADSAKPFLAQPNSKKTDIDKERPAGAVIVREWDATYD